ncbi:acetylcholinesterase [Rhypophila sp. PSN 637]
MQLIVTLTFALSLTVLAVASPLDLRVRTTSGTYTGFVNTSSAPNVNTWLGIAYAKPPLGNLRFMPPAPAPYSSGSLTAQAYKPICYQNSGAKSSIYWELIPEFLNRDVEDEDCLYLNIWAPRNQKPLQDARPEAKSKGKEKSIASKKRGVPVIIWIVGGGFKEGGGHALYQVPEKWVGRMQSHIVVTFNYRLHVFGFPGASGTAAHRNAGLMDVRLLVEWVRDNISGFGGDPNRIILYGQSAGANIAISYSYAYPTDPIIAGIIATSSSTPFTNPTSSPNFHNLAVLAGCPNVSSTFSSPLSQEESNLLCLQSLPASEIQSHVNTLNSDPFRGLFRPIADNITIFTNLTKRLVQGQVAKIPLIGGFTYNEQALFLPFDESMTTAPPAVPVPGGDGLACGIKREIDRRLTLGGGAANELRSYRYLFSGNFSNITPRYWLGGMHSSDIPLVFGTHDQFRGSSTELEWQTSFAMQQFWVSFASSPSADPQNAALDQTWPLFTAGQEGQIMVFGNATGLGPSYIASVAIADRYSGPCN